MDGGEAQQLKALEDENRRSKLVVDAYHSGTVPQ